MIITTPAIRASESTHWYTRDGVPRYTVIGKNGRERNTTLRDARTESLIPSVTTIINVMAKPGLTAWLQQQVLLAALTLPRNENEAEEDYIDRIISDSKEQGRAAADAGTDIHASIQGYFEGKGTGRHMESVTGCSMALKTHFGSPVWVSERSFGHEMGFGGKCDLHSVELPIVVDIKTKEFTESDKIVGYDEHVIQLAAYRVGLGIPHARCANVFVSRTVPGLAVVKEWDESDLVRGFNMFASLLRFWQLKNEHS